MDGKRTEGREETDGQWGSYLGGSTEYWKVPRECECVIFFFLFLSGTGHREGNPLKLHLPLFFPPGFSETIPFHFLLAMLLFFFVMQQACSTHKHTNIRRKDQEPPLKVQVIRLAPSPD